MQPNFPNAKIITQSQKPKQNKRKQTAFQEFKLVQFKQFQAETINNIQKLKCTERVLHTYTLHGGRNAAVWGIKRYPSLRKKSENISGEIRRVHNSIVKCIPSVWWIASVRSLYLWPVNQLNSKQLKRGRQCPGFEFALRHRHVA